MVPECSIEGCGRPHHARGLCQIHYRRIRRGGAAEGKRAEQGAGTIQARFWAKVDKTPTCWLWTGATSRGGYGKITSRHIDYAAHRMAYQWAHGPIPEGMVIDHTCHNKACVNPDHLRLATIKQNAENARTSTGRGKSGIRGVLWSKRESKWFGRVRHNGGEYNTRYFDDINEASQAVKQLRLNMFTHNDIDRAA